MGPHTSYFLDVMFSVIGLFFIAYILYGRTRKKPLVGEYRPGMPGYAAFRKLVNSNKYLAITLVGALFFVVNALFDARSILLSSSPRAILVVAPAMNILILFIAIAITPFLLGQRKK